MVLWAFGWSSLRLGLFVEGRSDKLVIRTLVRKVLAQTVLALDFRELNNGVRSFDVIRRHTEALLKLHPDLSKVIVCADLHSDEVKKREIKETEKLLEEAPLRVPVKYVKILHAIEGWILADANALMRTLGSNAKIGGIPGDIESRCDQVAILKDVFGRNGKQYGKVRWAPAIAEHIDVNHVATRMVSFGEFVSALKDP